MLFLSSFLQYAITFAVLVAIGILGAFVGIRLRKRKNERLTGEQKADTEK